MSELVHTKGGGARSKVGLGPDRRPKTLRDSGYPTGGRTMPR
ncbi:MAG: hypothetical protein ABSB22_26070 [Thermodesulfobacteriota bacterium]